MKGRAAVAAGVQVTLERVLGRRDLILLFVVAVANLNIVPSIAGAGLASMPLWLLALVTYFWPQGVAVIELSEHWPNEGGIYLWSKRSFGEKHGFLAGWCYWLSSVVYLPTVLLSCVGVAVFCFGPRVQRMADDHQFTAGVALLLLALLLLLNIRGMELGKWVNNLGGYATAAATVVVCGLAVWKVHTHGTALDAVKLADVVPHDWRLLAIFGIICYSLQGLDLASIMGDEIKEPKRNLPIAIFWGGLLSAGVYVLVSVAMLIALPADRIGVLGGVLQAVSSMADSIGLSILVAPLALLEAIAILGTACAWFSGTARLPFVAGIDRYLPPALGKVHSKYRTPYVALIVFALISGALIALSYVGATVSEAYVTMLDVAVIIQMVPNGYLFGSLLKLARDPDAKLRSGRAYVTVNALLGLGATAIGLILAFVPVVQVHSVWLYEAKLVVVSLLVFGTAYGFYRRSQPIRS